MRFRLPRAALLACALASPATAFAGPSECDAIVKAMLAVPDQPGVRQVIMLSPTQAGPTSILHKDAMYIREHEAKAWMKVPLDAAKRRAMAEAGLKALPLNDCQSADGETLGGVAVNVYAFKQRNPLKPGGMASSRILIGASDGLPRRMDLPDGMAMSFEYGDFPAPTP
ncbi:hypothetical protein IHQ68_05960 [Chelatococcus sambhunathii]|uniref:Uncharacterized protein n=1 Tax=Chelatococcus sambhunathii TaxID=363953 RepID=A0ABU1DDI2_9HYPH|nr:hypothetical protein [Chelatococcus sambhunathii]MDR4306161.1 hypothetical protein [Chelatococcus sambhunathii]